MQCRSNARVARSLEPWNIGCSDVEADHWLVLETAAGNAWITQVGTTGYSDEGELDAPPSGAGKATGVAH